MKILALERELPGTTAGQFQPLLKDEARCVWEMQQSGLMREIYFGVESHNAVLIMECAEEIDARRALARLPLVKAGLIEFELISLVPYDGFARLFE
jgi:hypothetical protein